MAKLQLRDGETRVAVEKKGDKWALASEGGRDLASEKVQTLIDSLRNLSATSFASDSAADQSKYGLGSPAIEVEVTQAENNGATEKVLLTTPSKDHAYAARDGQPTTYEVEKSAVTEIQERDRRSAKEGRTRQTRRQRSAEEGPVASTGGAKVAILRIRAGPGRVRAA